MSARDSGPAKKNMSSQIAGTEPIEWEYPLDQRMRDGARQYFVERTGRVARERSKYWHRDLSSVQNYERSVADNRRRFARIIGVADTRVTPNIEKYVTVENPGPLGETATYRVWEVRWPVLADSYGNVGVYGRGLYVEQKGIPKASVVAIPDADLSPEQIMGLSDGVDDESQFARKLAERGFEVVVPALASRSEYKFGQSEREWIYRQAFHMGRHVLGYEVQVVLSAAEWFRMSHAPSWKIGVAGYGEGALVALYSAAMGSSINASLVSGYFNSREGLADEPLYRNLWGLLCEFGDAEIATLIAPQGLVVEYSEAPEGSDGRGKLAQMDFNDVRKEFERIESMTEPGFQPLSLIHGPNETPVRFGSDAALRAFCTMLGIVDGASPERPSAFSAVDSDRARSRRIALVRSFEAHVQQLVAASPISRNEFFPHKIEPRLSDPAWVSQLDDATRSALRQTFIERLGWYRDYLWSEVLGRIEEEFLPARPRTRLFRRTATWTAYEVVLDVWPKVFAYGFLIVASTMRPTERRPVVVVQPGLEQRPEDPISPGGEGYNNVAGRLAEAGYVVFIPQNLYRGGDDFRTLDKAGRPAKASMWSIMVGQHMRIVEWLKTLPFVDPERIGFYGCSYGGTTAMYLVPLIDTYRMGICSANFNDWTLKISATHNSQRAPYMFSGEWEMPFFDMGNTFSHAEMAYLMIPRPFMVERGMYDPVADDSSVASEYAKVRWLYVQLGLDALTEIEFKNDGHGFLCSGAFDFIRRHLKEPARSTSYDVSSPYQIHRNQGPFPL